MKVCAFGECLIDFTPCGVSDKGNALFEQNPGGAPANLAVAIARQGGHSAFVGKVGQDMFGDFLIDTLKNDQVETRYIVTSERYRTSLAFVHLHDQGERDFTFYRNPGADVAIESREINYEVIQQCDIFHFGSVSMTHNPSRLTTFELLDYAKKQNKIITYDPNLREPLWNDLEEARYQIKKGLHYCDMLKVTDQELRFITEIEDINEALDEIQNTYDIPLVLCTMAEKGCLCKGRTKTFMVDSFPVQAIDSTGAGDAFFGCFLASMCELLDAQKDVSKELENLVRRANAAGALATTVKGAIPSLPTKIQVDEFLKAHVCD